MNTHDPRAPLWRQIDRNIGRRRWLTTAHPDPDSAEVRSEIANLDAEHRALTEQIRNAV